MRILKKIKFWWYTKILRYPPICISSYFSEGDIVKWVDGDEKIKYGKIIVRYKEQVIIKPINMYSP